MGEYRKVYTVLVEEPEGKRRLGSPRGNWEDGIKMELRETSWEVLIGFDWLIIRDRR
jgi:hypothetical protein